VAKSSEPLYRFAAVLNAPCVSPPLTVAEVCDQHYLSYALDLRSSSRNKLRYHFARWARLTGDPPVGEITAETFELFRRESLELQHSPRSVETVITDVLTVLRRAHAIGLIAGVPDAGRRLKKGRPRTTQPSLTQLAALHRCTAVAVWPLVSDSAEFWRRWIEVAYFTALRLGDLCSIVWQQVRLDLGIIEVAPSKTSDPYRLPIHPRLFQTLEAIGPRASGLVFEVPHSPMRVRRELRRMSAAAGVPTVTPQMIRRCAGTAAEKGRSGGGSLILGRPVPGADAFYLDREALLRQAVDAMPVPPGWAPTVEAAPVSEDLAAALRGLTESDQRMLLEMAARLRDAA
jgi:integrase